MRIVTGLVLLVCVSVPASASASSAGGAALRGRVALQEKPPGRSADSGPAKSIAEKVTGARRIEGFVPLYWDESGGKLWMEIARFGTELLYQVSLPAGVGSNAIGLDRGQMGHSALVTFERVGPKVLMVQSNYRFRALTSDAAERRAVGESFARSVLWGFKAEAVEGDRVLVDATAFFLRDAHGVVDRLRQAKQGRYKPDESRSALYLPRTKGFPKNTEVEATLTFTTDEDPGRLVRDVAPAPETITVREHHSFVELPPLDGSFAPRRFDPRVSSFGIAFNDFASPLSDPIEKRWVTRHRLQKKDPAAGTSDPVKPIVYYVDNGAPEPIRSALVEGASWWNQAFEAAGFRNAFQVKVLPDDADPMDLRYNVINWVHRSSRGWSYGGSVVDPRTGEILKGNVTLGSLRVRQDYLIGSGLVPEFTAVAPGSSLTGVAQGSSLTGVAQGSSLAMSADHFACDFGYLPDPDYLAALDPAADAVAMSLARLRQLAAHETGHTLGFAHNFAASTYGRASVMDYPAPWVEIKDGHLDLSNAYGRGIGAFDTFAVRYAYTQFPSGTDEEQALDRLVRDGIAAGMLFISDDDSRPAGAAHPLSSLWDNGADPVAALRHEMDVRRIGLAQFGLGSIPVGTPLSMLEAKLVPLYLHHRYQLQAAVKSLGGLDYTYSVKTPDGPSPTPVARIVPPARQREALRAVLDTLKVDELLLPARILDLIPPRAFGHGEPPTEVFERRTDLTFDPLGAATIAADLAVSALLQRERAARLVEYHARASANPGFDEVVLALMKDVWYYPAAAKPTGLRAAGIAEAVQDLTVTRLMDLASDADASPAVRAIASAALRELRDRLKNRPAGAGVGAGVSPAHLAATRENLDRFLSRPDTPYRRTPPLPAPPGDPIGIRGRD